MKQQFIATVLLVLISFDISNSAKSTFFGQGTNEFVPNTRVLTIDHYSQEDALQDSHVRDQTWAQRYYRIRTPLKTGSKSTISLNLARSTLLPVESHRCHCPSGRTSGPRYTTAQLRLLGGFWHSHKVMYRYSLIGYSYGQGQPMDCVWVGYLYDIPKGPPIQNFNECQYPKNSNTEPTTFIQDDTLYLKLGPISRFANGFELLYQGHFMNATLGLRYAEYGVTATRY